MSSSNSIDLALRLADQDHALEPGRVYRLGSGGQCEFMLRGAVAACQAQLWLQDGELHFQQLDPASTTLLNGFPATTAILRIGDCLALDGHEARVVRDLGLALIVPDPALKPPRPTAPRPAPSFLHRSMAAMPMRRQREATFADILADELRRAPWFGLSLLIHLLLLLLAIWLVPAPEPGGRRSTQVGFEGRDGPDAPEAARELPKLPVQVEQPAEAPLPDSAAIPFDPAEAPSPDPQLPSLEPSSLLRQNQRLGRAATSGDNGDVLQRGGNGLDTGGFRKTVSELRQSGLDIVFVFDSTGSMSQMIDATKQSIADMLEVLRALVPDARFGLVTYRDRGRGEEYLLRQLPLGQDFWRARNFMQGIEAGGGGDRAEAVQEALQAAFGEAWRPGARVVIILAGDAPAHEDSQKPMLESIRRFCRTHRATVHAVITSDGRTERDLQESFTQVAQSGGGVCVPFAEHRRLMQLVLSLAVGREYERNIDQVYALVAGDRDRTSSACLDLVRSGGEPLQRALLQQPVPPELVRALVQRPSRANAVLLARLCGNGAVPESTRQAAGYVLQQVLDLTAPPGDAERGGALPSRAVQQLERLAERLPD